MKNIKLIKSGSFDNSIEVSADKSISHRAVILAAMATGTTKIRNYLMAEDTLHTVDMLKKLGVPAELKGDSILINGVGLNGFNPPSDTINLGNSGTAMRISSGFLAAQHFMTILTGDNSLRKRPMNRILKPLNLMGAKIYATAGHPPIAVVGNDLNGILYESPVASAQVKTAIMLAGLYADGVTELTEPSASRDHTERLFDYLQIPYMKKGNDIRIMSVSGFNAKDITIPGDISSASFFIIYTILQKDSKLKIMNVNINDTRTGLLKVLKRMGINIEVSNVKEVCGEFAADLEIKSPPFFDGTTISGAEIPHLIDEIPILSVLMSFAQTKSEIRDAAELRVKETDRIKSISSLLRTFNVNIDERENGFIIYPSDSGIRLNKERFTAFGDHRMAMSAIIFAAAIDCRLTVNDIDCINTSFPAFFEILHKLKVEYKTDELA